MRKKRKKIHAPTIFAMVVFVVSLIFFTNTAKPAQAATYNWYFSQDGCDEYAGSCGTYGDGSIGDPWKSLVKVESQINSITNGTDTANIFLNRGDTWTFTSNSDLIQIDRSNVTIDAYGTGAKPILDGNNAYPTGVTSANIPYNYAIIIGSGSNVSIKNLKIQNMYPGGGITFVGRDGGTAAGPGLVEYCDIDNVGWAGIYDYGVHNDAGPAYNIKIEHCSVTRAGQWPKNGGVAYWPCAIGAGYNTSGLEIRYNVTSNDYTEGIDLCNNSICEYNMVTDTHSGAIYYSAEEQNAEQVIIRYNLVWNDSDADNTSAEIRVDDELKNGDNANSDIQIYGNVVIGGYAGLSIRNNPDLTSGGTASNWGSFKIYNNTLIDNEHNIIVSYPDRFTGPVFISNNASIISADVDPACDDENYEHLTVWNSSIGSAFTIGPNFYYGNCTASNNDLKFTAFQNANNVFGTSAPLPKTSGWRNLTSLDSFSFSDFYPDASSQLINRSETDQISGYDQYLTTGTNWETLPDNEDFVLADQDTQGTDWDFGAIINQQSGGDVTPPATPSGLSVD